MKKILAWILCAAMLLSLCACGSQQEDTQPQQTADQGQVQEDPTDDRFTEVERDSQGNVIRTLEGERGNGGIERFYDSNGTLLKEEVVFSNGQHDERTFYANGSVQREIILQTDGCVVTTEFHEDGYRITCVSENPDGYREIVTYNERDLQTSITIDQPEGTHIEITFYEKW